MILVETCWPDLLFNLCSRQDLSSSNLTNIQSNANLMQFNFTTFFFDG
jgi:hypothetical protein